MDIPAALNSQRRLGDAVLKIGFDGSPETRQEHLALQHRAGDGAVQMLARGRA
ncbi:hypothetical protein L5G28_15630 [Gordonia sp. HY285]|uniref:hypothetical protein n=1 Tax=Gordonia liuliyuniae TaxID=2911517 RepID=UPI001F23F7E1|nr:hypothetical protein [Gordonia liuliyuniae]MCF8611579.1 hypothetical protein [Gordonia liuliyuniae]